MHVFIAILVLGAPVLGGMGPAGVDAYLSDVRRACPSFQDRLARVARDALGTPYANGPLGEGPKGKHDQDPLIDLGRVDCVTYVEQTVALAASASYEDAFDLLQRIRYREGRVDFASRNHFMITDWLSNNRWCEAVTSALDTPVVEVTRTIRKKDYFKRVNAPELGQDLPDLVRTITVVPPKHAARAARKLTEAALIIFVGKVDWLFALHCGLYLPDEAGGGKLYHASSKAGKVAAVDLAEYMQQNATRYVGFAAYTIEKPRWNIPKERCDEAK